MSLKNILHYNPETGIFIWINPGKYMLRLIGKEAGSISNQQGRKVRAIKINNKSYLTHRLAWLYVYGVWPKFGIDHKNGDSLDNRITNLREATHLQNMQNHKEGIKTNALPTGVCVGQNGKYRARIAVNKKQISLGSFSTTELAHAAYTDARDKHHDAPRRDEESTNTNDS